MILSIDPGVRCAGVAYWTNDGRLSRAWLAVGSPTASPAWLSLSMLLYDDVGDVAEVVIERPQIYARSRSKGDPNDLISVALAAGLIVGEMLVDEGDTQVFEYLPAQWKGQAPKTVITERTKRALASAELSRVVLPSAASLAHNVWDAVGLGLYHLKKGGRRE